MKKVSKNIIILICLIKFQNSINMEASKYINLYTLLVQQQDSNTFTYPAFPKQLLIYNNNSESLEENLKTTTTGSTDLQIKLPAEKEYIINITNTFNKKTILGLPFDSSAKGTSSYLGYSLYSKLQKEGFDIHGLENINPHNITEWPNTNINIFTTGKTSYNESGFEISKIGELCPKLIGLIKYIEIFNKKEENNALFIPKENFLEYSTLTNINESLKDNINFFFKENIFFVETSYDCEKAIKSFKNRIIIDNSTKKENIRVITLINLEKEHLTNVNKKQNINKKKEWKEYITNIYSNQIEIYNKMLITSKSLSGLEETNRIDLICNILNLLPNIQYFNECNKKKTLDESLPLFSAYIIINESEWINDILKKILIFDLLFQKILNGIEFHTFLENLDKIYYKRERNINQTLMYDSFLNYIKNSIENTEYQEIKKIIKKNLKELSDKNKFLSDIEKYLENYIKNKKINIAEESKIEDLINKEKINIINSIKINEINYNIEDFFANNEEIFENYPLYKLLSNMFCVEDMSAIIAQKTEIKKIENYEDFLVFLYSIWKISNKFKKKRNADSNFQIPLLYNNILLNFCINELKTLFPNYQKSDLFIKILKNKILINISLDNCLYDLYNKNYFEATFILKEFNSIYESGDQDIKNKIRDKIKDLQMIEEISITEEEVKEENSAIILYNYYLEELIKKINTTEKNNDKKILLYKKICSNHDAKNTEINNENQKKFENCILTYYQYYKECQEKICSSSSVINNKYESYYNASKILKSIDFAKISLINDDYIEVIYYFPELLTGVLKSNNDKCINKLKEKKVKYITELDNKIKNFEKIANLSLDEQTNETNENIKYNKISDYLIPTKEEWQFILKWLKKEEVNQLDSKLKEEVNQLDSKLKEEVNQLDSKLKNIYNKQQPTILEI